MDCGANKLVIDQSHMEMTMKTEVDEVAPSIAYVDNEIDVNHFKQEPGLVKLMKSEPSLLVQKIILENSGQSTNAQQGVPATSTCAMVSRTFVAADSVGQDQSLHVKDELEDPDLYIGPTVLQHMDSRYRTNQIDVNQFKQEAGLLNLMKSEPLLLVQEKILENSGQSTNEQQGVPATSTCAIMSSTSVAADGVGLDQSLDVKDELEDPDLDIGPTVLQHMDSHYRTNQLEFLEETKSILNLNPEVILVRTDDGQSVRRQMRESSGKDNKTINCMSKYCSQTKMEEDYNACHTPQTDLQQHLLSQHHAMKSGDFKSIRGYSSKWGFNFRNYSHSGIKLFVCHICDAKFCDEGHLARHLLIHTSEKLYQSITCDARFTQSDALSQHKKIHAGGKPYQCDICDARFTRNDTLNHHKKIHTGEKPYQCDTCDARFAQSSTLYQHKIIHTGEKPYQCATCDARFTQKGALSRHKKIHTGEKLYQCDTCDVRFAESSTLKQHKKIHTGEKPYQCDTCNARFTQRGALSQHKKIHTGEKPYQCDTCEVRFAHSFNLKQHKIIHTGEKHYQCDSCDARFAHSGSLNVHKKTHTGEKPYHCVMCDVRFAQSSTFNQHKKIHTGEKPYQCDTCSARFTRKGAISRHRKIHTGEKPYQCDTCDARFTQKGALSRHKKIHTGFKPYQCDT